MRSYYYSSFTYVTSGWKIWYKSYVQACIVWALKDTYKENPIENQMYLELEGCKKIKSVSEADMAENDRISRIIEMLSTEKIFLKDEKYVFTLHQILKWLTLEQCEQVKECILILKDCCDVLGIRSILEGAHINETKKKILLRDPSEGKLSKNEKKYQPAIFVKRLELMTTYIQETANIKISETETIGERYWIQSTGSDPHCKGRHALFLVNKSTNKIEYVYKPHDLSADNAVVGMDGMLAEGNKLLPKNKKFATVHIDIRSHLEDFVTKKSQMTQKEAKKYFYKAGMLQVITDAMVVTDLHQDNIMPTEDGPLIIDAEVDFFRANFSGLLSGLTWIDSEEYPRTACFWIDEGKGNMVHSGKAFQDSRSDYRKKYREGQMFMLKQIQDNQESFLKKFDAQLQKVTKARILPMSTQFFSDLLQTAIGLRKTRDFTYLRNITLKAIGPDSTISELASAIVNEIVKKFANIEEHYVFTEKAGVYLNERNFWNSIMETFKNGTIIAMYMDMYGNIYLDDEKIGYLYDLEAKTDGSMESSENKTRIVTNITTDGNIYIYDEKKWSLNDLEDENGEPKQLSKEQIIKMIKDHFNIKFNTMKSQMGVK